MSTSRERVALAIRHCITDRIPKGELCIDDAVILRDLQCERVSFPERYEFVKRLGLDLVCLAPEYQHENGLPESDTCIPPDLDRWTMETQLFSFALLDGVFGWGLRTLGYEEFFKLPMRSPQVFTSLLKEVEKLNIELAKRLADRGVNGVILADDIAYQRGLLFSPRIMREFFFPSYTLQIEKIAQLNIPVFYHSDGNLNEVIQDLIQCGFQGLNCVDRKANMDILELQQTYGKQLCFWGTLDVDHLESSRDPVCLQGLLDDIHLQAAQPGFILGTNSGIFDGMDISGLKTIYRSV